MQTISESKIFDGYQKRFSHRSECCDCEMTFSVYLPPQAQRQTALPVLYWLSGLTCTDENFVNKAGAQRYAAEHGVVLVAPDTSPRNVEVPGEDESYDFGAGAGFYVNATEPPWSGHYRMYDYVTAELRELVNRKFPVDPTQTGIFGHSMGGHGALMIALRNPSLYGAVSAFAPICAPMQCPWGRKAFSGYLGSDKQRWRAYDSVALIEDRGSMIPVLIDQGDADSFLADQLKPELLRAACNANDVDLALRMRPGYDHSYFFIASFISEHIAYHAEQLRRLSPHAADPK